MAKNEVLYGYARTDNSNHIVSIDDIDRSFSRTHKFFCPHCNKEMYATFGEVQMPHFRHNGDKCQHDQYLHSLAKRVFYDEYSKCLKEGLPFFLEFRNPIRCNMACVLKNHIDCSERYIKKTTDLTKEYKLISLETTVTVEEHYRRPDILIESFDGKQLWIEIWVSHETDEEKRKDGRIIEIKINSEKDLEMIRNHKMVQSEGENLAVRLFNIETEDSYAPSATKEVESMVSFPCEKFLCLDVCGFHYKFSIIEHIKTDISSNLSYRVVLRLNWKGDHDSIDVNDGEKTSEEYLRTVCFRRYNAYECNNALSDDNSFTSLIAFEWKPESFKPVMLQRTKEPHRSLSSHFLEAPQPITIAQTDISDIEWIDLGLPSGTLWAKDDINRMMSFAEAKHNYEVHMPSKKAVEELRTCKREWNECTKALVFTGPNGNSISFHCKSYNKTYWLNAYEQGDAQFGQCFHIGPDGHFYINDKDSSSAIFVRLVK